VPFAAMVPTKAPSDAQETATVWMAERSFLGARTVEEDDVLAQAIQARRKKSDDSE
jgi:hypothetical protein